MVIGALVVNVSAFAGGNHAATQSVPADSQLSSRMAFSGGMGVEYLSAPNVVDFVNTSIGAYTRQRVPEFKSAVQFFGALSFPLSTDWVLKASTSISWVRTIRIFHLYRQTLR